ncbi:hypothetical protein HBI67_214670 [Parastagonospora nodorum]|nr:hypothetical protein HBI47_206000 [Parastagonospora nodorum]KAH6050044.1 hypothetical protein HBI67_214670 [Parastagonospora nodorum]KAH6062975.1 hypothetical protein HBI66_178780 [Parastagonospora nodorum]
MSVGFSVGDFIAVGKLINDISSCLQDAGGAKAEYQELLRELECLQQALHHLDKLQQGSSSSPSLNLDSIKYAALSCRRPLEQFLGKIQKYDKSLGVWGKKSVVKRATDKLKWGLGQKEEVRKLQGYLNIHVGTINILLAEHGLEKMDLASGEAVASQILIREQLEDTRSIVDSIRGSLNAQALVIDTTQKMTARLCEMIGGELRTSVSTQQTYTIPLEIKSSLVGPDTRWAFFQAPLAVEDALGFRFPVPSEYDFDLLEAVIRQRFKTGPGSLEVRAGNYEYLKTNNSTDVLSQNTRLLPGSSITMAVIVDRSSMTDEACPMSRCDSIQTNEFFGGGRNHCKCGVWFSPTQKKPKSIHDPIKATLSLTGSAKNPSPPIDFDGVNKRAKVEFVERNEDMFKNVRLAQREVEHSILLPSDSAEGLPDAGFISVVQDTEIQEERGPIEFNQAISYVNRVKNRFADRLAVYMEFISLLQSTERQRVPVTDAYKQIVELMKSAPDLVDEFTQFLPISADTCRKESNVQVHDFESDNPLNSNTEDSPTLERALRYLENSRSESWARRIPTINGDRALSQRRSYFYRKIA